MLEPKRNSFVMEPIEAVLVGAGQRGTDAFGAFARKNPAELKFVAVAEPHEGRRKRFAEQHGIPAERQFADYREMFARPRIAPVCVNATMDKEHLPSALAAMEAGYHLFLEKPMADTAAGCVEIVRAAERTGRMVMICTPLRFTPFYSKVKELLDGGAVGRPLAISSAENVASWHFAHSFVRGNWGVAETSGPLILTKCCHDMDLIRWLVGSTPDKVVSQGDLLYFRPESAPADAPARCTDGCPVEKTCPYFAPAIYGGDYDDWPVSAISLDRSKEARMEAVRTGPYGRCVFHSGNTAVDEQTVGVTFANGLVHDFAVRAHTVHPYRSIRVLGTEGELNGHLEKGDITVQKFEQAMWQKPPVETHEAKGDDGAHMGGDGGALRHFFRCVREGDAAAMREGLQVALEGHLLSFAAEEARAAKRVVDFARFAGETVR